MKVESEKTLDRKLVRVINSFGGMAIKLPATHLLGLPDRLCLLPGGKMFFVEVKTTGKQPTIIQLAFHKRLRAMGFYVYVVDSSHTLDMLINLKTI